MVIARWCIRLSGYFLRIWEQTALRQYSFNLHPACSIMTGFISLKTALMSKTPSDFSPIEKLKNFAKFSPKFLFGLTCMSLPAGYIGLRHINWKSKPDSKKRMLISHLVFWPVAVLGLRGMHLSFGKFAPKDKPVQKGKLTLGILTSAGVIAGGFEGGLQLAKKLIPKKPYSSSPSETKTDPKTTQLAYQQGLSAGYQMAAQLLAQQRATFQPTTTYPVFRTPVTSLFR